MAVVPKPPNEGAEDTAGVPKPLVQDEFINWDLGLLLSFCGKSKNSPVDPKADVWPKAGAAPKPVFAVVVAVPNA